MTPLEGLNHLESLRKRSRRQDSGAAANIGKTGLENPESLKAIDTVSESKDFQPLGSKDQDDHSNL